jgi:hypothetical protein
LPVLNDGTTPMNPRWKMRVCDQFPEGSDGTGHHAGIECPCYPDVFTDGTGAFFVLHNDFTEQIIERFYGRES